MINMNEMMKTILDKESKESICCLQVDIIVNEIVNKTKIISDCIIYDEDGLLEDIKINFDEIKKMFWNWKGYEVGCNELRLDQNVVSKELYLTLVERLHNRLTEKYKKKIVVYFILNDDAIDLRFHTYREDEGLWLDEDLNKYDTPIFYWM